MENKKDGKETRNHKEEKKQERDDLIIGRNAVR